MKVTLCILVLAAMLILGCAQTPVVEFVEKDLGIDVVYNGKTLASYDFSPELGKPVLNPVYSPSGVFMTRHIPPIEGETADHPHHLGLFFAYENNKKDNFWAVKTDGLPNIDHIKVVDKTSEPGKGTISTEMHWMSLTGKILLKEERTMVFVPGETENTIDFTIKLTAVDTVAEFQDTKEGMFAIRTAEFLREKDQTGKYLSSNGEETEKVVWGKRAKWMRLQGEKDGNVLGIVIMNHPESINYPCYWHARNYGLFSANPLGQGMFQAQTGVEHPEYFNLILQPYESALFKFQMVIYEGDRTLDQIESLFLTYSK